MTGSLHLPCYVCQWYVVFNNTGDDYTLVGSDLTFSTTGMSSMVTINADDDSILEGDETFTIVLDTSSVSTQYPNLGFPTTTATVTITDDERECV